MINVIKIDRITSRRIGKMSITQEQFDNRALHKSVVALPFEDVKVSYDRDTETQSSSWVVPDLSDLNVDVSPLAKVTMDYVNTNKDVATQKTSVAAKIDAMRGTVAHAGVIFSTKNFATDSTTVESINLISAALAIAWYAHSKGVHVPSLADAIAPTLILGYGIGRLGCHLAGDGDWGIASNIAAKPSFLPTWLWSETYPNNILGMTLPESGVYPTSIYEFLACTALFGVLWALRKHAFKVGWLFMAYIFLNGLERFSIEQIRVNNKFDVLGVEATQAEVIASLFILVGLVCSIWLALAARRELRPVPTPS